MMHNKKQNRKKENYNNNFDDYKKRGKRQHEIWEKYTVQLELLLKIYSTSNNMNNINEKEFKNLATKYTIQTSEMYKMTTYQAEYTTMVDNNSSIILKKSIGDIENSITDMLDIAILKGWNLESLTIEGSCDFVEEVKKQIQRRQKTKMIQDNNVLASNNTHLKI